MIYDANDTFDFKKNTTFISPKLISSGCYFIRCFGQNQNPLYIQSPKCKSKQGIVKTGNKKMHCDLIFTHEDEAFLRWIEDFENQCQQILFDNRNKWFDSDLEMHDIENSFASSFKMYKSQHVLRANIPIRLGKCSLKIYDEQEQDVDIENISSDTVLMTILEIQGIKCSSRSFQIDFEIKQMMVLNPVDLFEKCVISKKTNVGTNLAVALPVVAIKEDEEKENAIDNDNEEEKDEEEDNNDNDNDNDKEEEEEEKEEEEDKKGEEDKKKGEEEDKKEEEEKKEEDKKKEKEINLGISDNELCEIDFSLPSAENEDVLHLKKRNDVYFEMYSSAKKKAKLARQYALSAYLEAKRIKNTYLLDEVFEDDDDDDEDDKFSEEDNDIFKINK
jgi:hypothetical protein